MDTKNRPNLRMQDFCSRAPSHLIGARQCAEMSTELRPLPLRSAPVLSVAKPARDPRPSPRLQLLRPLRSAPLLALTRTHCCLTVSTTAGHLEARTFNRNSFGLTVVSDPVSVWRPARDRRGFPSALDLRTATSLQLLIN